LTNAQTQTVEITDNQKVILKLEAFNQGNSFDNLVNFIERNMEGNELPDYKTAKADRLQKKFCDTEKNS
jgi:hypothetical protein